MAQGAKAKTIAAEEAPTKKAPVKKAMPLLTKKILGEHIAETFQIPKSHGKEIVDEIVDMITKNLIKGGKVQLRGLGVFDVRKRAARKGVNPFTGEAIKIKAAKRVGFTTGRDLRAKL